MCFSSPSSASLSSDQAAASFGTLPGYRFAPTDEDLIQYYIPRITSGYPIVQGIINLFDVYSIDPSALPCAFIHGNHRNEEYFFSPRHRSSARRGKRASRTVGDTGVWHINGETDVHDRQGRVIGRKASFTFKKRTGDRKEGLVGTDWMMQELLSIVGDGEFQEWAMCRIYNKKRAAGNKEEEEEEAAVDILPNAAIADEYSYGRPSKKRARICC